jgi:hypothetical protein
MAELATKFGGKSPGELIRTEDWNGLIDGIEALTAGLAQGLSALGESVDRRLAALERRADRAEAGIGEVRETVDFLLRGMRRVTLRTGRVNHAIGELAEIRAQVTDARGNRIVFAEGEPLPSIDFVTSWGQLRPAPAFQGQTVAGTGDRTLSVRVNANGEAVVLLRAEHAEGFTVEAEQEVETSLTTILPAANLSIRDTILTAATPMEASLRGAFQVLSREYERTDVENVRRYVDTYFVRNPGRVVGPLPQILHETWRDYRATVLAFVKDDSDPTTAEPGQGVCSLQVTFRDWIGPWLNLDYLTEGRRGLADDFRERFGRRVGSTYAETVAGFRQEAELSIAGKGVIGRHRDYLAMGDAFGTLTAGGQRFVADAAASAQSAIGVQQTLEVSGALFAASSAPVALQAFAQVALNADSGAAATQAETVRGLQEQISGLEERVRKDVGIEQQTLRDELLREDGPIFSVRKEVETFRGQVSGINVALERKADIQSLPRFLERIQPGGGG